MVYRQISNGGRAPKCSILINVNCPLFTEYVKYVNLVLLSKGSSMLLVGQQIRSAASCTAL